MKNIILLLVIGSMVALGSCKKKGCTDSTAINYEADAKKDDGSCVYADDPTPPGIGPITGSSNVEGYNILAKLPGIWNGPVTSPTPLGSFAEWIVDFRPISPSQISAKNELDSINDIFMSFFIVKYDNAFKVAFRNGGGFAGSVRNSYMIIDSVSEGPTESFYRFSDPISGGNRVYTNVLFKLDSIIMTTYTNQFNTLSQPSIHMEWRANLRDQTSTQNALTAFNFPQKEMTRDFSNTFTGLTDAVFYSAASDPYPEAQQPYLGNSDVNISITNPAVIDPTRKVVIIVTTQPLFPGGVFNPANLDFRSRYVFVDAASPTSFNFNYMHPGSYYVNAIYDTNGDLNFATGDYMNVPFDVPMTLAGLGNTSANVTISFQIP
ncbi:MAG: hypothetical protein COA33_013485 [Fluviicola sp.]|nr:hypothetical protein [Fluviicola sp.]